MKSPVLGLLHSWLLVALFGIISCNRYIDKTIPERKTPIMDGILSFYPDSNVLVYKSNVSLRMDTEVYKPKPFYLRLPKGLKWYSIDNSESFVFFYDHGQTVLIRVDVSKKSFSRDTTYVPKSEEMHEFLTNSSISNNKRFEIIKIEQKKGTRQLITKQGAATIILYNIMPAKYDQFLSSLATFRFL